MLNRKLDEPQPTQVSLHQYQSTPKHPEPTHLRLSVKSAVPGCALKLSAAPPTAIVIADPGPALRMFEHDCLLTLHTPNTMGIPL